MALIKVALLLCVAGVAFAQFGDDYGHHYHHHPEYKFEYSVHDPYTHDVKSQAESRHGDVVKGFYTLKEADGTLREVHYTADGKTGFHADVHRSGHAAHPQHYKSSAENFYHGGHHGHGHAFSTNNNNLFGHHF